jgi:hypothetical protein
MTYVEAKVPRLYTNLYTVTWSYSELPHVAFHCQSA